MNCLRRRKIKINFIGYCIALDHLTWHHIDHVIMNDSTCDHIPSHHIETLMRLVRKRTTCLLQAFDSHGHSYSSYSSSMSFGMNHELIRLILAESYSLEANNQCGLLAPESPWCSVPVRPKGARALDAGRS